MNTYSTALRPQTYSGEYMVKGKEGEEVVLQFLRSLASIQNVVDMRNDTQAQHEDYDFLVYLHDRKDPIKVEVKTDHHLGITDNVLFEILRFNHTSPPEYAGVLGWSLRSTALWFYFWAPAPNQIYACSAHMFRKCWQRYTDDARGATQMVWINTDRIKSTLNVLIPWDYCKDIFTIHTVLQNSGGL